MRIRANENRTVETARRDLQQLAVHLHIRQRRPAGGAETVPVSGRRQIEHPDLVRSAEPLQPGGRREQIRGMSRPGVLAAVLAVAEIELLEVAFDFEADRLTQT